MLPWCCFEWWLFIPSEFLATTLWWINGWGEVRLWYSTVATVCGWDTLCQRWPDSRKRSAAISRAVLWSIAVCISPVSKFLCHLYEQAFSQIKTSKLPDRWMFNKLPSLVAKLWTSFQFSYRKIRSVMHQLRSEKVYEKHLLIMVNYFSLKRSILGRILKVPKSVY
jgi:hypothetical protein